MTELVRVRLSGIEKNVGKAFAEIHGLTVLDEPTSKGDESPRPTTRRGGRAAKPQTSVADKAAEKKAAVSDSAPTEEKKS